MGIPKKGSRKIQVGGTEYRYKITGNDGYIDLIIEAEGIRGQRLTASFEYHQDLEEWITDSRLQVFTIFQRNQITPGVVRQVIEYGLQNGWTPVKRGKEMGVGFVDDKIKMKFIEKEAGKADRP